MTPFLAWLVFGLGLVLCFAAGMLYRAAKATYADAEHVDAIATRLFETALALHSTDPDKLTADDLSPTATAEIKFVTRERLEP